MREAAVTQRGTRAPGDARALTPSDWPAPDARRRLQLILGALWLLDAILQYQPVMFTRAFSQMLANAAHGNPVPVSGAPGPVILYALLAVLLWPRDRGGSSAPSGGSPAPFVAARAVGLPAARALWLVLWASLAYFALLPANRAPVLLAAILALIALGVYLPPPAARAVLAVAIVVAAAIWVAGQDLGGILTGGSTDPDSGPLLILLALAYWPAHQPQGGP